jgi:autotransporter-associated beta strand protein
VNNNTGAPTLPITVSAIGLAEYQGIFTTDASFPDVTDQGANAYVPNTIYVTNGTQVYLTKDGGQTWVERDAGLPNNIVQLVVDPRNMDTVYAVTNGFGNGGVWVSFNAGQKWTQIGTNNGLPNVPVWSFVIDPRNNNLYVGTDTGVYELEDGGVNGAGTWQIFGTGMPNVQVHDLVLNPTTNTLLAATYGRGVFELILDNAETITTSPTTPVSSSAGTGLSGPSVWSGPVILSGNVSLGADGAQNLPNGISTGSINFVGQISDMVAGSNPTIDKVGGGDVIFSGANTYGGLTDVQQGNLVVDNSQALGANSAGSADGTTVEVGAALELESNLGAEVITLNGDGSSFNDHFTGALRNIAGDNTYTGNVIFGPTDPNSTITLGADSGSELTMIGTISGGSAGSVLVKEGTGTIAFDNENPNTYSGSTAVYQGALQAETSTAFSSSSVVVLDGAQVQVHNTQDIQTLAVTATTGTFTLSFTGPNSSNAVVTDTTTLLNVASLTLAGDIQAALDALSNIGGVGGSVTVTQQSPGVFVVAFGGTLFGDDEQTLAINNLTLAGGTVTGGVVPVNVPNALNLSGTGIFGTGAMLDTGGNNTWSGNITLGLFPGFSPSTLPSGDVSIGANAGDTLTLAGSITDLHEAGQNNNGFQPSLDQESGLNKVGFGTVVLQNPHSTPNAFSGGVTVSQGILVAGDSGALGAHPTIDPTLGTVQQVVTLSNEQVGTFQLSFDGATTTMSYGTSAAKMEEKLTGPTGLFASAGLVGVDVSVAETPIETTSESLVTTSVPAGNLYTITFGGTLVDTAIPFSATGAGGTVAGASFVTLGGTDVLVDSGAELDLNNSNTPSNAIDVVGHTISLNGSGLSGNGALQNTAGDNTWDGPVFIQTGPASSGTTSTKPAFNASIGATSGTSLTLAGTLSTAVIDSVPVTLTLGGVGTGGGGTVIFPSGTSFALHTTITGGNVQVDGSLGVVELAGGAISGTGNVGQIVDSGSVGGIVNPGDNGDSTLAGTGLTFPSESNVPNTNTAGTLTSTGVTLSSLDTYDVYMGDPTPNLQNDSSLLQVNGAIALNAATLSGTIDPNVQPGSSITIIQTDYDGGLNPNDVVTGTFVDQSLTGSTPTDPGALATTTAFIENEKFLVDYYIDHVVITRVTETVTISSLTVIVPPGAPSSPVYGEDVKVSLTLTPEAPNVVLTGSTVVFQIVDPQGSNLQFTETVTAVSPGVYGATIDLPESLTAPLIETTNPLLPDYTVSAVYDGKLSNGALLFSPVSDGTVAGQTATEINGPALVSVAPANTTTTLKVSPTVSGSTYAFGTPLTFTATVTSTLPVGDQPLAADLGLPVLPPEGSVGFYDNQSGTLTLLGFGTLSTTNGVTTATLATSTLPVGIHSITAIYEADGVPDNYNTSNSNATPIALQVTQVASTMTLSANPTTIDYNGQIAFTATVIPPAGNQGLPTGNVTFQLGNTVLGTAPLFTVGGVTSATFTTASFQILANSGVLQTITASYPGDGNFGASSATTKVTVNPIGTTTPLATNTLTSSLNPSSAGQSVTFTDTIGLAPSEIGGLSPTGTVVFQISNGAQTITDSGTVSTLFGLTTATFTTTQMLAGTNTVTATYNGDTNYLGGSAAPLTQTVTAAATTTTLIATPAPPAKAVANQAVTLSATVTSPGGIAFGTVVFADTTTGKTLGTVALNGNGVATIQAVLGLPLGVHSITATFQMNNSFTASSGSATVDVAANGVRSSHVTLASSLNPSLLGQTVTFTATVKDAGVGAAQTPTGSVNFRDLTTGLILGYGTLSTSGGVTKATLSTSAFVVGSNSIVAVYTGSTVFAVSQSAALAQVVHGVTPSSVTVTSSLNPSSYGQVVKFTATVHDTGSGTLIAPTGTVSFVITNTSTGTTYRGTGTLSVPTGSPAGTATATFATSSLTAPLPAGTYTVTATYNGDVHFLPGSNGSLTQTVNQVASTTTLTGTTHSVFGQAVTYTATVKPVVGTGVPTGTVTFIDTTSGLTLGTVNVTTKLGKTTAVFTTRTLVPNSYTIEAVYNGNANVQTSTSQTVSLTVNPNTPTMTLVSSTTSSNTSVTFTTTVKATAPGTGTPTGTVSFLVDGVLDGTSNLTAGKAALTLPAGLPVGRHTIEAEYSGDTDFAQASKTIIVDFVVGRGT